MEKLVSVCLASFNGERYIKEQVESILLSKDVSELLVSDDGSNDGTLKILNEIARKDNRLKILSGPQMGLIKNFEFLIGQAEGKYIFLSDQDDVWMHNKVKVMLDQLESADLVVSDCIVVDKNKATLFDSYFSIRRPKLGVINNLFKNSYLGCCMAFRRSITNKILPFPNGIAMHDWWIGVVANASADVLFVKIPLVLYRRHDSNFSATSGPSNSTLIKKVYWRFYLAASLIIRLLKVFINDKTKNR